MSARTRIQRPALQESPRFRVGTVGAPISTPKRPAGSPGAIAQIRSLGLDAMELGWVRSIRISAAGCAVIADAARANDVALSVHASYFINLNAKTAALVESSRQRLLTAARAGHASGATDIVFHTAAYLGDAPETAYATVRERLAEIAQQLREENVRVMLRPETMGKPAVFGSLEECVRLAQDVERVLPCIDFAHLHARTGDGTFNTYDEFASALAFLARHLGRRAMRSMHIHLSGIAYGPRGERHHLPLQEADLRYEELFRALLDSGASGRILCESPILERDAMLIRDTLARLQ